MVRKQSAAVSAVQRVIPDDDPAWRAALRAPIDDAPIPEQERLDMEEVLRSSELVDGAVVSAEIAVRAARDE